MKIQRNIWFAFSIMLAMVLLFPLSSWAKDDSPKPVIRSWTLPHPLALPDSGGIDSSFVNFPMRDYQYDYSIANTFSGNLVSPLQSAIYFDRTKKTESILADAYDAYTITPQDVRFYNTTTPYSSISYKKGFTTYHEDNDLRFFCTGNLGPNANVGASITYLSGAGHYMKQEGKLVNGSVFGSYNGNNYSLQAAFVFNTLSNFENGGIENKADMRSGLEPEDIPVRMEGMNGYRYLAGYLNHYYSITVKRDVTVHYKERDESGKWQELDSIKTIYVPVTTFRHVFETNEQNRRYIEKSNQRFYSDHFRNPHGTRDSASTLTIRNTLSVTFEEEFNTKLKFGAIVYAYNECQRYLNQEGALTFNPLGEQLVDSMLSYTWKNNTFVGGELYKKRGQIIHYGFGGDVCVVGYKIGQFQVNGHLDANFKVGQDTMRIEASAKFGNETPDYYLQHYLSNHYRWDNDFKKPLSLKIEGVVGYPTKWVTPIIKVNYENRTNHIYIASDGRPRQAEENISVLAADLQLNITTPWINLDNSVVYQYTSSDKIPLPLIALYSNLYYHGLWFKAMDVQIGADVRYNTAYYAPVLDPATTQFKLQYEEKVGNYPIISVYANFYVRLIRLKFFAQYQHLNATFMNKEYYSMPHYPLNPDVFRAGLAWHFYR